MKTRVRIPTSTCDAVYHCPECNVLAPVVQGRLHCARCSRVHSPHPRIVLAADASVVSWSLDTGRMQHGNA